MTDEEKQAIEILKDDEMHITDSFYREFRTTIADKYTKAFKIVLNLIEKQQREKELHIKLEQQYKKEYLDAKEEIEKYKYLYQKALDNTIKADRENVEKDKIIDEMANHIATSDSNLCQYLDMTTKCKYYAGENKKTCDKCIKEYFTKKVEVKDE